MRYGALTRSRSLGWCGRRRDWVRSRGQSAASVLFSTRRSPRTPRSRLSRRGIATTSPSCRGSRGRSTSKCRSTTALEPRLDAVAELGLRAKVRCGGAVVPSDAELAGFVRGCRERGLVFKATAGLHHAVRSNGEHGFLNLLAAVIFEGREEAALARDRLERVRARRRRVLVARAERRRFGARSRPARALPLDRQLQLLRAGRGTPCVRECSPDDRRSRLRRLLGRRRLAARRVPGRARRARPGGAWPRRRSSARRH